MRQLVDANHTFFLLIKCGGLCDSKIKLGLDRSIGYAAMASQNVYHELSLSIDLCELMTENVPRNKDFYKKQNEAKLSRRSLPSHGCISDFKPLFFFRF